MTNSCLLKSEIKNSGLLKRAIMRQMGIKSYATLHAKVNNVREFSASEINKLSDILNLDKNQREAIFFASDAESNSAK